LVSLLLGAYDDGLATGALQVFSALTAAPCQHRTVFFNDHDTILHKEASLSDSLFDIVIAAGDNMMSVDQILSIRKFRGSSSSSSISEVTDVANSDGRNNGNENDDSCFYGLAIHELVNTSFPSRRKCHSNKRKVVKQMKYSVIDGNHHQSVHKASVGSDGVQDSSTETKGVDLSLTSSNSSYDIPTDNNTLIDGNGLSSRQAAVSSTSTTLSIGNWKGVTNEMLVTDERSLREIFLEDFVRRSTFSICQENQRERGDCGRTCSSSLRANGLCLLWRLRFIRCQYYKHSLHYRSPAEAAEEQSIPKISPENESTSQRSVEESLPLSIASVEEMKAIEMEGMVGVRVYYQAVRILLASHPNSHKISSFFLHKGDGILSDLITILRCKQRGQSEGNGANNDGDDHAISSPEVSTAIVKINIPDELCNLACQCLIAILSRAEDLDDEDGHRQGKSCFKQMPPFECIQERLGLERGQIGGLLVNLLREELVFLAYSGSKRSYHTGAANSMDKVEDSNSNVIEGLSLSDHPSPFIPIRYRDITVAIARDGYNRLIWMEQLLLILMACLPLPGVLTTIVDNGFMSLIQSVYIYTNICLYVHIYTYIYIHIYIYIYLNK
jgi:hypothetical protein